jgi:hypothetical protein
LQFVLIFGSIISIIGILGIYALKIAYQYQYLRLKNGLKQNDLFEAWSISLKKEADKKRRNEAVMLFPLFFPIVLDDKKQEMNDIKRTIKKLHIFIYLFVIVIMLIGVYSNKAFPNGILG